MSPEVAFSAVELKKISAFCDAMGADWCGLDILRDQDGRIYVVDVNKTDTGPIIALPLSQKLKSTALLGEALGEMIAAGHRRTLRVGAGRPAIEGVPQRATQESACSIG